MKKYLHIAAKVLFSLILILPIAGITGLLGEATRGLYNTDQAFAFIEVLNDIAYISYMMTVVHIIALIALWTKREALGALLELPITLNVIGFHLILDGGLFTAGAIPANIMLLLNLYFIWQNRVQYKGLLEKNNVALTN
jgi:hypothetical protein